MDGYGTTLSITGDHMVVYETTKISCRNGGDLVETQSEANGDTRFAPTSDRPGLAAVLFSPRRSDSARLQPEGAVGDRGLTRVAALPKDCTAAASNDRLANFDVFWQTYHDNYPFFVAKGYDWTHLRDDFRARVRQDLTDGDFFQLLGQMIEPLHDAHTAIIVPDGPHYSGFRPGAVMPTAQYNATIQDFIEQHDLGGRKLTPYANGVIGYADLPDRLGYLRVAAFTGYTDARDSAGMAAELDRALDDILTPSRTSGPDALRGLILDLRVNRGGEDGLGLRLASRLTAEPFVAYAKRTRNDADDPAKFTTTQRFTVTPAAGTRFTGPIMLLTSGSQVSAGETFTQAMMQRTPAPVRIGENTQGVFSDLLVRHLPNGWIFALPNEEFLTPAGTTYDGAGVPPDIRTPVFGDELTAGHDSAFERAIAELH
ncbi:S41 family peptidase [Nocardia sp. NPDC004722]